MLCDGHHAALHDGKLTITGKAPALEIRWTKQPRSIDRAHVGVDAPRFSLAQVTMIIQAKEALVNAGYTKTEARSAVDAAVTDDGALTLDQLIRAALRCCSRST